MRSWSHLVNITEKLSALVYVFQKKFLFLKWKNFAKNYVFFRKYITSEIKMLFEVFVLLAVVEVKKSLRQKQKIMTSSSQEKGLILQK